MAGLFDGLLRSELGLIELFTFPGVTKSLRKVEVGQLGWGRSPQK